MRSVAFVAAAALMLAFSAQADEAGDGILVGGSGGGTFVSLCKGDDVLIGFNAISGKSMNTFAAVCQSQRNGALVGKNYGLSTYGSDNYNGGPYHEFDLPRCQTGAAIVALHVWVNTFNEVDSASANCTQLRRFSSPDSSTPRTVATGGQATFDNYSNCPFGMIAVGVFGRSGALMDALGVKCKRFPWY